MADNIIIKITTEADLTAAQKQLKDMESAAYDLTKQMADLKKAEAEELKALEAKIKKSQEAIAAQKKYIEENQLSAKAAEQFNNIIAEEEKKIEETNRAIDAARKKHKDLIMTKQDEINANKQSIKEYNEQNITYGVMLWCNSADYWDLKFAINLELSRLAKEAGFADLTDDLIDSSSIMPQKKNPDMAELIRGKTCRVYGDLSRRIGKEGR